ncbi:MAG: class I SAM-dependent methyltransferase [Nitriliruptoraceae bacterium]
MSVLDRAFATLYDPVMHPLEEGRLGRQRAALLAGVSGHVLDLGAGTGASLPHMPRDVERVTAIEPEPAMAARLRARAAAAPMAVEVIEAPGEALPLADHAVDAVLATLVLCTVADPERTIAEIHRVLRPDGRLLVLEHVAAPDRSTRRRLQGAIAPAWRVVARGCYLTRDTRALLENGGFDVTAVTDWELARGGPAAPAITGVARPRRQ